MSKNIEMNCNFDREKLQSGDLEILLFHPANNLQIYSQAIDKMIMSILTDQVGFMDLHNPA